MLPALLTLLACSGGEPAPKPATETKAPAKVEAPKPPAVDTAKYAGLFKPLPSFVESGANPKSEARIDLGRALYFDKRLSKNHDIACNSCHQLDKFGVDGEPTSPGHKGQRGGRNSPTVYNAALHATQFWDGRAADVEAQAKGPVLNPIEMAMAGEAAVVAVVKSIPGYKEKFEAAFPGEADPITYDNIAKAIALFERGLVTPSRFDAFLQGDLQALTPEELAGLELFVSTGCTTCHNGAAVGGGMFQKLGLVEPYETADKGREEVTKNEAERFFFKVPSLRNIDKTGPYFHDGSVKTLDEAIRLMAKHQLGKTLDDAQVASIKAFLMSMTGTPPADYIKAPTLPESGPTTPAPDPS